MQAITSARTKNSLATKPTGHDLFISKHMAAGLTVKKKKMLYFL